MNKLTYCCLVVITSLLASCDIIDRTETKMIHFHLNNTGKSTYESVVVFAKDRNRMIVDSSYRRGYNPGHSVTVTIEIPKIKDVESGLFEIQAKLENGKLIIHEFGNINKPTKEKGYTIELRDSTIVFP